VDKISSLVGCGKTNGPKKKLRKEDLEKKKETPVSLKTVLGSGGTRLKMLLCKCSYVMYG
jgi:hypothetical protein